MLYYFEVFTYILFICYHVVPHDWKLISFCSILLQSLPQLLLVLVLAGQAVKGNDQPISTLLVTQIKDGYTAAQGLGEFISNKDFFGTLAKLSKSIAPFLKAIGPFVAFGLSFANTESPELRAIKELARRVDRGFAFVDLQLSDIKHEIKVLPIKLQLQDIDQTIRAVQIKYEHLDNLSNVSKTVYDAQRDIFITTYENDYQSSGTKLYNAVMKGNILDAIMEYYRYDRKRHQSFMLELVKLLVMASKLEVAYYELTGNVRGQFYRNDWEKRINNAKMALERSDVRIVTESPKQWKRDVERYAIENPAPQMNNDNFARTLYDFLNRKFYWLDWFVVAYNPVSGWEKHCLKSCGAFLKFRFCGRNFLVANIHKLFPNMDNYKASLYIDKIPVITPPYLEVSPFHARRSFNHFPSSVKSGCRYVVAGVIRSNADVSIYAPKERLVDQLRFDKRSICPFNGCGQIGFRVFLFGERDVEELKNYINKLISSQNQKKRETEIIVGFTANLIAYFAVLLAAIQ